MLTYFLKINILTCYSYMKYVNLKNYSLSLTLDYMQDIFVNERGYMPKIQVSHRIRVNSSGIFFKI